MFDLHLSELLSHHEANCSTEILMSLRGMHNYNLLNDGSPWRSCKGTMPNRSILMMNVHLQVIDGSLNYNADIDDQCTMVFVTSWAGHTKRLKTMMTQLRFYTVHLAMFMYCRKVCGRFCCPIDDPCHLYWTLCILHHPETEIYRDFSGQK